MKGIEINFRFSNCFGFGDLGYRTAHLFTYGVITSGHAGFTETLSGGPGHIDFDEDGTCRPVLCVG